MRRIQSRWHPELVKDLKYHVFHPCNAPKTNTFSKDDSVFGLGAPGKWLTP